MKNKVLELLEEAIKILEADYSVPFEPKVELSTLEPGDVFKIGEQKSVDGNIQSPLFLRPALSATSTVTTSAVFAHFVSFPLQSLNQRSK